jgi:hypothetical protein
MKMAKANKNPRELAATEKWRERYATRGFGLNFLILLVLWTGTGIVVYIQLAYGVILQELNAIIALVFIAFMMGLISLSLFSIIILIWVLFGSGEKNREKHQSKTKERMPT